MSDRYNPRQSVDTRKPAERARAMSNFNALSDPPDNPEFGAMPDATQALFAKRFAVGMALTEVKDTEAYRGAQRAWQGWVARCHAKRLKEREAQKRERVQREAILEQNRRRVR